MEKRFKSTTVEILQTYQTWKASLQYSDLQQQKSYRRIRHYATWRINLIYNSRNLIDVLDKRNAARSKRSTTVEILQTYQTFFFPLVVYDLQQQKSYRRIRLYYVYIYREIYNSRNLIDVLDTQIPQYNNTIYNSRNLIDVLDFLSISTVSRSTTVEILQTYQTPQMLYLSQKYANSFCERLRTFGLNKHFCFLGH